MQKSPGAAVPDAQSRARMIVACGVLNSTLPGRCKLYASISLPVEMCRYGNALMPKYAWWNGPVVALATTGKAPGHVFDRARSCYRTES